MTPKSTDPTPPPKLTRAVIHEGVLSNHGDIVAAVHKVLNDAGLQGVSVHSIRFSAPSDFGDPCDPPCPAGQRCVLDSNGGSVRWVCVPQ